MKPTEVYVNARVLTEPLTGLQRSCREILRELDAMFEDGELDPQRWRLVLLTPAAPDPDPGYRHLEIRVKGPLRSHAWEQLVLPRLARGFLVNLKNTAPLRHPRMSVTINDLQVFARPQTHTRAFGALYRHILPRAARRARVVMTISKHSAAEIERWLGVPEDQVLVTYLGHEHVFHAKADDSVLARAEVEPGSYLLAVSSLNPNKNFAAVPRALNLAELGDTPFVIAGGANPKVFERSSEQKLPPGCRHVGRVADGELRALYENALGFVFPSFYEGFGLPPLEAMALGCPVLSSNTTSLPEVCGDAVLYCDPADDADIARQLVRLVGDGALREELAAKGRMQAAKFRWRECARRVWSGIEPWLEAG